MKKTFTILLTALYLTLSVGLNVLVHTCGGESETMLATTTVQDPCGCGDSMSPEEMCCTTVVSTVKLDDAQKSAAADPSQYFESGDRAEPVSIVFPGEEFLSFAAAAEIWPPPNTDLTILHSVFRI